MTYDGENRMTAFQGGGAAAGYSYDGNGNIVEPIAKNISIMWYLGSKGPMRFDFIHQNLRGTIQGILAILCCKSFICNTYDCLTGSQIKQPKHFSHIPRAPKVISVS